MKVKLVLFITLLVIFSSGVMAFEGWQIEKSKHFIVYSREGVDERFIRELLRRSEDYYTKITRRLGFNRYNFWLWDERAKIYLYRDAQEYRIKTGAPSWSGGHAAPKEKIIKTHPGAKDFFNSTLPHEMGHIIFREFVGTRTKIPLWLDEGVASLQEEANSAEHIKIAKGLIKSKVFISLDKLSKIDRETMLIPEIFYIEAASLVNYLIKEFGRDNFVKFCRRLRDGEKIEEAIRSIYHFQNLSELNEAWVGSVVK